MADPAAAFSPDYFTARPRFHAAASAAGFALEAHPVGDGLTVDVALAAGAGPAVVVTAGVHGAEAAFGAAVVLAWLTDFAAEAAGRRAVLVTPVSPWAAAHRRRADRGNVDANRNFLLPGEAYTGGPPLYATLDPALNPARPPGRFDPFAVRAALAVARHGRRAVKNAVAAGQYTHPRGLFYGGAGPTAGHRVLAAQWPRWVGGATAVTHLDFHTGLGAWGAHKLLLDEGAPPGAADRARRLFGPAAVEVGDAGPTAYPARGSLTRWAAAVSPGVAVVALCAEFGTYPDWTVLAGLRAENQAHHSAPGTPADARAKARLTELFTPADPGWRRTVVAAGAGLIRRAMTAT